jgi:hypothetical protein
MADEVPASPLQSSWRFRTPVFATRGIWIMTIGAVAIVALLRAKREDIPLIVKMLVDSYGFCATGWILAVVIVLTSIILVKLLKSTFKQEIDRLTKERDELQKRLIK